MIDCNLKMLPLDGSGTTIISRTLFHTSAAMHDVWAIYTKKSTPFLIGQEKWSNILESNEEINIPDSLIHPDSMHKAIAFAAYRIMMSRYANMNGKRRTIDILDSVFMHFNYYNRVMAYNYKSWEAAQIGNYVAKKYIEYGLQDGAEEGGDYEVFNNISVNPWLKLSKIGHPNLKYKNRWQPTDEMDYYEIKGKDKTMSNWNIAVADHDGAFLTPQWGNVIPFALSEEDVDTVFKYGKPYPVYLNPGPPPLLDYSTDSLLSEKYKWGFLLVALWSGYQDPTQNKKINISPKKRNTTDIWTSDYPNYYDLHCGETKTKGIKRNPVSKKRYKNNKVNKGDYTRTITEYWADGVNTSSPTGHWLNTLGQITDHELFERKWMGKGEELDSLEWDVKSYFTLTGALHDAAVASWGVKVAYEYVRPISAIRYMAFRGQCSDTTLPRYHLEGLPLIEGKIELVKEGDPLLAMYPKALNRLKIYSWKGPNYVDAENSNFAGVGWTLAEGWWPYQRYSFVTPPYAGYVSGHSCFSIAAAEVLSQITGSPFFPGGLAEFTAKKNEFLLFENGPSKDITLQWARYYDAAIESCESRVYGGVTPPCDDMMGRKMGEEIGKKAVIKAQTYFNVEP